MNIIAHVSVSLLLFITIVGIFIRLLNKKYNSNCFLKHIHKKSNWKRYDYVWYTSGFIGILIFAINLNYAILLNNFTSYKDELAKHIHGVVVSLRIMDDFCSENDLPPIQVACHGVNKTYDALQLSSLDPDYPLMQYDFADNYALIYGGSMAAHIEKMQHDRSGSSEIRNSSWGSVLRYLENMHNSLTLAAKHEGTAYEQKLLSDIAFPIHMGVEMNSIQQKALETNSRLKIYSPIRFQGVWWIYTLSILISIKVVKTRAEIIL
ncbi:hypothetical protein N9383_03880 [Granulosicoccus sp.]|nr:hypothetical protein [Granulosicoccus sp.]